MKTILSFGSIMFLLLLSCKKNPDAQITQSSTADSLQKNIEVVAKESQYTGYLYGINFPIVYPLRVGAFGDRLYSMDSKYKRQAMEANNALALKAKLDLKIDLREDYRTNEGYSYGFTVINSNLIAEVVGFGWNDNGMSDDVKYFTYLITHDSTGKILDSYMLALANNMDSIAYQEVNLLNDREFLVIRYEFTSFEPCDGCSFNKTPTQVNLIRNVFKIGDNGKIEKKKALQTVSFNCKTDYNVFTGIFKGDSVVKASKYWLVD